MLMKIGIKMHENQQKVHDKTEQINVNQHEKLLNLINKKKEEANKSTKDIRSAQNATISC